MAPELSSLLGIVWCFLCRDTCFGAVIHQVTHKTQLFFYLKLLGVNVDTRHLYGMEYATKVGGHVKAIHAVRGEQVIPLAHVFDLFGIKT